MNNLVEIAAQLYDVRRTVRNFLRDDYRARMLDYGQMLEAIAEREGRTVLSVAVKISMLHAQNGMLVLMVLAAAIELIDPTPEPVQ